LLPGVPLLVIYSAPGELIEVRVFPDEEKKQGRELLTLSGSYRKAAHRSWCHETRRVDADEYKRAAQSSTNVCSLS
jgi:hypothetical protein